MERRTLSKFASYKDSKDFQSYLREYGTDDVVEASGGLEGDIPTVVRLGGVLRAFREYHVDRIFNAELQPIKYEYYDNLADVDIDPSSYVCVGILHFDEKSIGDFEMIPAVEFKSRELECNQALLAFWA